MQVSLCWSPLQILLSAILEGQEPKELHLAKVLKQASLLSRGLARCHSAQAVVQSRVQLSLQFCFTTLELEAFINGYFLQNIGRIQQDQLLSSASVFNRGGEHAPRHALTIFSEKCLSKVLPQLIDSTPQHSEQQTGSLTATHRKDSHKDRPQSPNNWTEKYFVYDHTVLNTVFINSQLTVMSLVQTNHNTQNQGPFGQPCQSSPPCSKQACTSCSSP